MPDTIPSQLDVQTPFDPTGYASLSGAQLEQFGGGITPYTDKGMICETTDIAGNPQVPDATTYTKWQNYIWRRVGASSVTAYIWNPTAASDATFLKWQSIASAAIPDLSITGAKIAEATITSDKLVSVAWSLLTGIPSGFAPTGAAGGDLSGTYPNPTIAAGAINTAKCSAGNVALQTVGTPATANYLLRTNSGATSLEWFSFLLANLGDPSVANAKEVARVNAAGNGWEYFTNGRIVQQSYASLNTLVTAVSNLASASTTPNANATGMTDTTLSIAFTPATPTALLASSFVDITVIVPVGYVTTDTNAAAIFVGLYTGTGAVAPVASGGCYMDPTGSGSTGVSITGLDTVVFRYRVANPGAQTYVVRFGTTNGSAYVNSINGANALFGALTASISLSEYVSG